MKKLLLILAFLMTGCATDYKIYSDSVEKMSIAKSNAEAEKYKAMGLIAESGSDAAKVAAVMSMALSNQGKSSTNQLQAPRSAGDTALQWLGLIIPSLTQGYAIHANSLVGIKQADTNARIAESTNSAFVGIAGKIQAPTVISPTVVSPVIPQANVTTNNTDNHTITGSYNPATTSSTSSVVTTTTNTASGNTTPTTTATSNSNNPTTTDNHAVTTVPVL